MQIVLALLFFQLFTCSGQHQLKISSFYHTSYQNQLFADYNKLIQSNQNWLLVDTCLNKLLGWQDVASGGNLMQIANCWLVSQFSYIFIYQIFSKVSSLGKWLVIIGPHGQDHPCYCDLMLLYSDTELYGYISPVALGVSA